MELSQPVSWINQPREGYVVNAEFSAENTEVLRELIQSIEEAFPDAVFGMPEDSLHITLLDWIAPLVDYNNQDKSELFAQVQPAYDQAMSEIVSSLGSIVVRFAEIRISPSTIFVVGHDNGEFQHIREQFVERVELLPDTKRPPQIIHSSLARFVKPVDLDTINSFIGTQVLDITQLISEFRLVHTTKEPMLEFEILKRYKLE